MLDSIRKYVKEGGLPFVLLCIAILISNRNGYISIVGIFVISVLIYICPKQKMDIMGLGLIIYCFIYLLFSSFNGYVYGIPSLFLYGVAPYFFYSFGRIVPSKWHSNDSLTLFWLIVVLCYCLDIFIVTVTHIAATGEFINVRRDFSFDGEGEMELAATLVGLAMDVGMIGLPAFILSKNKGYRYVFLMLFLLSVLVTLHLLNRTGLVVLALCSIGVIGWRARKKPIIIFSTVALVVILYILLQSLGILSEELLSYYTTRNEDLSSMGSRSDRWAFAIRQLFIHPLGWGVNGEVYNVHNMWLDIARVSGIVPFALLLSFTASGFIKSLQLIKMTESAISYIILGLNICFFASCFVEPIYGGTHFLLYCMLWGFQSTLSKPSYNLIP